MDPRVEQWPTPFDVYLAITNPAQFILTLREGEAPAWREAVAKGQALINTPVTKGQFTRTLRVEEYAAFLHLATVRTLLCGSAEDVADMWNALVLARAVLDERLGEDAYAPQVLDHTFQNCTMQLDMASGPAFERLERLPTTARSRLLAVAAGGQASALLPVVRAIGELGRTLSDQNAPVTFGLAGGSGAPGRTGRPAAVSSIGPSATPSPLRTAGRQLVSIEECGVHIGIIGLPTEADLAGATAFFEDPSAVPPSAPSELYRLVVAGVVLAASVSLESAVGPAPGITTRDLAAGIARLHRASEAHGREAATQLRRVAEHATEAYGQLAAPAIRVGIDRVRAGIPDLGRDLGGLGT